MKQLLIIVILLLVSSCITSNLCYYNTLIDYTIIILEKRYIPGFQNPNIYQLKVLEGNEYRWINVNEKLYNRINKNDTIYSQLLIQKF